MKTAEEWLKLCPDDETLEGNLCLCPSKEWIKQIQLDAWKQGMSDASLEVASHWNTLQETVNQKQQSQNSATILKKLLLNKKEL